jgi:hypothetical protein
MIAESKLDNTFQDNLFQVDGYNLQRRERDQHGGGLLTLIKSDFPRTSYQLSFQVVHIQLGVGLCTLDETTSCNHRTGLPVGFF